MSGAKIHAFFLTGYVNIGPIIIMERKWICTDHTLRTPELIWSPVCFSLVLRLINSREATRPCHTETARMLW
jgi:hypothetical protein